MRRLLWVSLLGLVASSILAAQQSSTPSASRQRIVPTFRSDIDAVLVDFTVVDREGRFVRDLTAADVQVFEDGREQAISSFSLVDIPIEPDREPRFAGTLVDRDVTTNAEGEGRLYLIALDDVHIHPLRTAVAKAIARQFVERNLGPHDRAALVAMSGRYALAHEFTGNRQQLLAAIDKLQGGFGPFDMSLEATAGQGGKTTFHYLESLAKWMSGLEGRRKTLIFISEGFSTDIPVDPSQSGSAPDVPTIDVDDSTSVFDSLRTLTDEMGYLRDVIEAAARANVSIYTIDPRGQPGGEWSTIRPAPNLIDDDQFSGHRVASRQVLNILAAETGGFSFERSNDFTGAFDRIVRDTSSHYVLGYTSDNPRRDGKFRRLRVRVTRPGLRVRARTGYVERSEKALQKEKAPQGWTPDHVALVNNPTQTTGLSMRISAAPFRGPSSLTSTAVIVEALGEDLKAPGGDPGRTEGFTVVLFAADPDGREAGRGRGRFEPNPSTPETAFRYGVRFVSRLPLKPGRYALRVAASDGTRTAGNRGSVYFDLDVPDFSKGPLTMSGVLLTSQTAGQRMTIGSDAAVAQIFDHPPTANRGFEPGDELTTMVTVYSNRKSARGIAVAASVQGTDGKVVFTSRELIEASRTSPFPGSVSSTHIPLRGFSAGDYLLTIEASNASAPEQKASRQVVFSVR